MYREIDDRILKIRIENKFQRSNLQLTGIPERENGE